MTLIGASSCVVAGRFNPAILTPPWIVREGILPEGETEINQVLGSGTMQFRLHGIKWLSSLNKLEVHSEAEGVDPGAFAAAVLEKLPHTPIRAVGNNFAASLPDEAGLGLLPLLECPLAGLLVTPEHEGLGLDYTLTLAHGKDALIRVAVETDQSGILAVSFNVHRDCSSAAAAADAARQWQGDRQEVARLLERFFAK